MSPTLTYHMPCRLRFACANDHVRTSSRVRMHGRLECVSADLFFHVHAYIAVAGCSRLHAPCSAQPLISDRVRLHIAQVSPAMVEGVKSKRVQWCLGLWWVGNVVKNGLQSTGAFEVFYDGHEIFRSARRVTPAPNDTARPALAEAFTLFGFNLCLMSLLTLKLVAMVTMLHMLMQLHGVWVS